MTKLHKSFDTAEVGKRIKQLRKSRSLKQDDLSDLYDLVNRAIVDEPPITMRDGGIIKEGFSSTADELRNAKVEGKQWLSDLETREKEATGIKNLEVKFNKVFGYYLEVTNRCTQKMLEIY